MNPSTAELLQRIRGLADAIGRPIRLMEVCGTHTMAISRSGLRALLPPNLRLLSGPGCPVCVTPVDYVDKAIALARRPDVVVMTFGDMLRVPGSESSLEQARAEGARVRVVYSPLDAFRAARSGSDQVVFLGVGFETTAPTVAWTVREARRLGVSNYSVLCAHKLIPPAMRALLDSGECRLDGFLCPGHVSVMIGTKAYEPIAHDYRLPCVVAGFEVLDILRGVARLLEMRCAGLAAAENAYERGATSEGNPAGLALLDEVFTAETTVWRGLGALLASGLALRPAFDAHDAEKRFAPLNVPPPREPKGCRCGDVLRGACLPDECPLFGRTCAPENPVGACMVSSEGSCAAHFRYEWVPRETTA